MSRLWAHAAGWLVVLCCAAPSLAAQRTFVSTFGSDANPCTAGQPCRSFGAAIAKTNAGGEVIVLDSGGYGPVAIAGSVSLIAPPGIHAAISAASGNGITITGGAAVTLRGLALTHQGAYAAIHVDGVGKLLIERCTIDGPFGVAIRIWAGHTDVTVKDTVVSGATSAIAATAYGWFPLRLSVIDSTFTGVTSGIGIRQQADLVVENSSLIGTSSPAAPGNGDGIGLFVTEQRTPINAHISNSTVRGFYAGVRTDAEVLYVSASVSNTEISHNWVGVYAFGKGTIALHNNRVVHNNKGVHVIPSATVYTSGTNWFAYDATADDPMAGPGGLK